MICLRSNALNKKEVYKVIYLSSNALFFKPTVHEIGDLHIAYQHQNKLSLFFVKI